MIAESANRIASIEIAPPTQVDYERLCRIVKANSGIALSSSKQALVLSRLSRRLRALGLDSFSPYLDLVEGKDGEDELSRMISSLTTNVTRFFREEHHFEKLRQEIIPRLLEQARKGGRVRIWSAGCSTGEEAYSIASCLYDLCPEVSNLDVRILATDIDPEVVRVASDGRYTPDSAERAVADMIRKGHLVSGAGGMQVSDKIARLVSCRVLNLIGNWPFRGKFDVIFCRNVVIYFDDATRDGLWRRFSQVLVDGGYLFIGHSERIPSCFSNIFESDGVTSYVRIRAT